MIFIAPNQQQVPASTAPNSRKVLSSRSGGWTRHVWFWRAVYALCWLDRLDDCSCCAITHCVSPAAFNLVTFP